MNRRLQAAVSSSKLDVPRAIPDRFLLGAAAAAYQIEGAALEAGRQASIWDTFTRVPGAVVAGDNGDVACDHFHRYKEDVALMKRIGLDSYRFSISWARVMPDGKTLNREGLDFYQRLIDELQEADILPWLTLYHWDLPQALQDRGGWPARDTAKRFLDYAMTTYDRLGDRVQVWTTLNEPWCSSFLSYTGGEHAPGHQSLEEGMLASHHLLLGHGWIVEELRRANPDLNLGLTLNLTPAQPLDPDSPADQRAARLIDGQINRWFLDPLFRRQYPQDIVEEFRQIDENAVQAFENAIHPGDMQAIGTRIDTLGINYYQPEHVVGAWEVPAHIRENLGITTLTPPPDSAPPKSLKVVSPLPAMDGVMSPDSGLPRTAQKWQIDPIMLKELLHRISADYTKEAEVQIVVTENGAAMDDQVTPPTPGTNDKPAVHDPDREAYLALHLAATLDALEEGVNVGGYFYWSLLDNFEWTWGYDKRFGIIYVDYKTQERILKDSGKLYSRIISDRTLDVGPDAGRIVREGTLVQGRN